MATASRAAGFQLRQTAWAMQALATGLKSFERYRLWVLKNAVIGTCFLAGSVAADKFSFLTSAKR
jgi:hypothetical protein